MNLTNKTPPSMTSPNNFVTDFEEKLSMAFLNWTGQTLKTVTRKQNVLCCRNLRRSGLPRRV